MATNDLHPSNKTSAPRKIPKSSFKRPLCRVGRPVPTPSCTDPVSIRKSRYTTSSPTTRLLSQKASVLSSFNACSKTHSEPVSTLETRLKIACGPSCKANHHGECLGSHPKLYQFQHTPTNLLRTTLLKRRHNNNLERTSVGSRCVAENNSTALVHVAGNMNSAGICLEAQLADAQDPNGAEESLFWPREAEWEFEYEAWLAVMIQEMYGAWKGCQ